MRLVDPQPMETLPRPIPGDGVFIQYAAKPWYDSTGDSITEEFDETGYTWRARSSVVNEFFIAWSYTATTKPEGEG